MFKELDHADFLIKDRQGLVLVFTALRLGLKAQGYNLENFPIEMIYRHWSNSEAQVRFCLNNFKNVVLFIYVIADVSCPKYITKF